MTIELVSSLEVRRINTSVAFLECDVLNVFIRLCLKITLSVNTYIQLYAGEGAKKSLKRKIYSNISQIIET